MSNLNERYINPLTDFGFKKLFGTEPNKDLLIDFLNQILPERHQIKDLNYSRNEQLGQAEFDRKAIFDLYCKGESGERFIVEVQKAKQNHYRDIKNVVDTSREEGKEERTLEIARELKKNGISIDAIIESTGLSREEIEKL